MGETLAKLAGLIGLGVTLAALGFALWKGGRAERQAAVAYFVASLVSIIFQKLSPAGFMLPALLTDGAVAVFFLWLAVRYSNLWLGALMIVQGLVFAIHALAMGEEMNWYWRGLNIYFLWINISSLLIILLIFGATIAAMRRRAARRKAEANPASPPLSSDEAAPFP